MMRRRWQLLLLAAAGLAGAAMARGGDDAAETLRRLTAGRTAGAPARCIFPDNSAAIEVAPGTALGFRVAGTTYISRFPGGCPALTRDRRIVVSPLNGRLCRDDGVFIVDTIGGTGHGFCPLGVFEPWRRNRGGK